MLRISTSKGSRRRRPWWPLGEWVETWPEKSRERRPEISMRPPSPVSAPRARRVPWQRLVWSAQTTIVPPCPDWREEASSRALFWTVMLRAWGRVRSLPCQEPPTRMVPPPAWPRARRRASAVSSISSARISMRPPRTEVARRIGVESVDGAEASRVPDWVILLRGERRWISPDGARSWPCWRMAPCGE